MAEIGLTKRVKFAGDVHAELLKAGWDLETATLFVNNIPDADVAPVVHGRWDKNAEGDNIVYCDQCLMPQDMPTPYCPNCGARMDGELYAVD